MVWVPASQVEVSVFAHQPVLLQLGRAVAGRKPVGMRRDLLLPLAHPVL